ncbi:MAG: AI-2E family transporter [Planctomycetota bacterium]
MIDRLSPVARNAALAVLSALLAWFCWSVRAVLNPLILAYLLAFILHPLVLWLEKKRGWKRRTAVNAIFGGFALAMTLFGFVVVLQGRGIYQDLVVEQGISTRVRERIDAGLHEYQGQIDWVLKLFHKEIAGPSDPEGRPLVAEGQLKSYEDLQRVLKQALDEWVQGGYAVEAGRGAANMAVPFLKRVFGGVVQFLALLILLPIYTWFLLFELERIHSFVQRYLPQRERSRLVKIGTQIGEVLSNFFRGRLLVCLCKGLVLAGGLAILGVPYSLLIGFGTGFLTLIPFVGSLIGFVVALLVAFLEYPMWEALWRTGSVFLIAEGLENYFLIPKILGDSLGLHPIVVIFSLLAGAASLGMFGLLIALPLTASLVILAREFVLPVLADLADRREKVES